MKQPKNVRIDERLIHGQVAALWTKSLRINRIVVIDPEIIKNKMQKTLLKTACPGGIKLSIISPKRAAENFNTGKYDNEEVMVIVKGPEILKLIGKEGFTFKEVNVGNMTSKANTYKITNQIYITEAQKELFNELSHTTDFYTQLVPTDEKKPFDLDVL